MSTARSLAVTVGRTFRFWPRARIDSSSSTMKPSLSILKPVTVKLDFITLDGSVSSASTASVSACGIAASAAPSARASATPTVASEWRRRSSLPYCEKVRASGGARRSVMPAGYFTNMMGVRPVRNVSSTCASRWHLRPSPSSVASWPGYISCHNSLSTVAIWRMTIVLFAPDLVNTTYVRSGPPPLRVRCRSSKRSVSSGSVGLQKSPLADSSLTIHTASSITPRASYVSTSEPSTVRSPSMLALVWVRIT
mmetsp:Transcript_19577/g.48121  ORF Transcript_19577/g.48121 Transcript_19577/m.48121 type:complete len:252 (+) Transcript_19577:364-1119(+)